VAALFDGAQWMRDARVDVGDDGRVASVAPWSRDAEADASVTTSTLDGVVVPALPNLHGHAFQRGFAGRAEQRGAHEPDSFWAWRTRMYAAAAALEPDRLFATATALYRELRAAGFGSVAEFHYVHHAADGRPYDDPLAMTDALVAAADAAGIRLCLLPVLYQRRGFDDARPLDEQRRFVLDTDAYLRLLESLQPKLRGTHHRAGIAFHSLRAVPLEAIRDVIEFRKAWDATAPVHVHVAEQPAEVEACLAAHRRRPVELLLESFEVDAAWCLVHATHTTPDEVRGLASAGAVAGLCPTTEANLGDGLFDLPALLVAQGHFGVGTDSHVSVCPFEELRWLEYGQRLRTGRRLIADGPTCHVGTNLWSRAATGGARALGLEVGRIEPGAAADWLVFEGPEDPDITVEELLDVAVFARPPRRRATWIAGRPPA
jgi:formimidoylglutamate deiminase